MKLPNSLTAPSNRSDATTPEHQWKAHRYLPGLVVLGWASFMCWPVIKDSRALLLIVFTPAGFIPWLERLDVPVDWRWPLSLCLLILLLSLPWFSILAGSLRATTVCTVLCLILALGHIKGCQLQMKQARSITSANPIATQAQRACVIQPRVRRTLGIESPHAPISPNPNGVPSKLERSTSFAPRESVLECSSPLELFAGRLTLESAGGPAHSRTLPRLLTHSTHL